MNDASDQRHKSTRRPRLLLLAYFCNPVHGSEFAVGWNRVIQASRYADTWVICEAHENEADVRQFVTQNGPIPGLQFVFLRQPSFEEQLRKVPGAFYLTYHLWHRRALALARRLHAEHCFDLAHQVNCVGYREPGFLWRLPIPFVWGPVGGTQNFPYRFLTYFGLRHGSAEFFRNVLNSIQLYTSRRVRLAARKASVLIVSNETNERDLVQMCGVPATKMVETGITHVVRCPCRQRSDGDALRILWSGYIKTNKALPLLIDALTALPKVLPWKLRVLGRGSMYSTCRRRATRLGINDRIEWLGWRKCEEAITQYSWADVFVFTSLRDTTGTVLLEAISHGVPVICMDHQGAAGVITPECGIKIQVTSPGDVVRDLANALQLLAIDDDERRRLAEGAFRRAEYYLWSRQGDRMAAIYRRVLADAKSDAELQEHIDSPMEREVRQSEVLA